LFLSKKYQPQNTLKLLQKSEDEKNKKKKKGTISIFFSACLQGNIIAIELKSRKQT
jgi:hypothetical protein